MATEADIPAPICETRREQGGNIDDQATSISINKLPQEEKTQADTPNGPPTVEGENFLRTPSIGEVHCEVNKISQDASKGTEKPDQTVKDETEILLLRNPKLDDQPLEIAANEETSSKRIQQNAEESNGSDKDEDRGVVTVQYDTYSPAMTSGVKAGDILLDPDLDDVIVETQLSTDTTRDHHGTNDSFTKKMALPEEILQETNLPSGENEFNMLCFSEDENLNVQVKTTNDYTGDGKTTEEDISCNLTSASKEGEGDQNKMTSEWEGLGNERNFAENLDTAAEKAGQENSTVMETITHATSDSDEFQSKKDLNSSFCKEEDIPIQKGDRAVTTPEDSGILLENTVNESHGDVEKQPKTLEDTVTNHSNPKVTEKTVESSLIQVDGSQMERDEQLEKESEKLPLTEVSTGDTNDNGSAVIDKVKDEDEDLSKAQLFENEKNTSTLLKEDAQTEKPVESLHVAPENIKATNLGQENKTSSPEEHSTNVNLHGITSDNTEEKTFDAVDTQMEVLVSFPTIVSSSTEKGSINAVLQGATSDSTDEKTIDEVDTQKEVLENFSTIVSNEEIEENSMIKLDGSETKNEELLEKESEKTSSPQPLAREASDNESMVMHEARIEDGELMKSELCENEKSTESMLLEIESKIEKPECSLNVASEDIKASNLGQEIETRSSFGEQSVTAHPQIILDGKTDDETLDAAETKEETLEVQNVPTIVSNEKTDENSLFQVDGPQMKHEEHLEKDREKPFLIKDLTGNANDDELTATDEVKIEDENPSRAELFHKEKNIESALLKEEAHREKHVESLHVARENIKASNLGQENKTRSFPEERSTNANLHGITSDNTDEKTIDVVDTQKEVLENFSKIVSNEEIEENSMIKMDGSKTKNEELIEKESEKTSLQQPLTREASDNESTVMHEARTEYGELRKAELCENEKCTESMLVEMEIESKIEKPECSLNAASEDIKASDLGQEIETSSFKEQSVTAHPQVILGGNTDDKTLDAAEIKEEILEVQNVPTIVSNEKTEENSLIQVDGPQMKNEEHLEKDREKPSLIKDLTRNANDDELTVTDEVKIEDESPSRAELFEKEKSIESALLKEEVHMEKPVQSFHAVLEDNKASDLGQHTEITGFLEEQSLTENPQGILGEKTEEKTTDSADTNEKTDELQNVATNVSNEDNDKNSLIQLDASQMKHDAHLEKEMEKPSLKEASTEETNDDESTIMHEIKIGNEDIRKVGLFDSEKNIDSTLLKKENLQDAPEDHKASASSEDIETTCSLEEQSLTENLQAIMSDKTNDATDTKEVVQNITTKIPYEHTEENLVIQVDCSQMEHEEHLEKESENSSLTEAPKEETNDNKSKNMHESKDTDEDLIKAELLENEKTTVSTSVKEEAQVEKPTDSLQAAPEDIKASDSSQDTIMSSTEVQIHTADPQEISSDKTEEKTVDAVDTNEETLEDTATNIPDGDNEDNLLIEEDGSQKPSLKEVSTGKANDDESLVTHEAKFEDESSIKDDLFENEKNNEGTLVKEEVSIESLQVAAEDIKASALQVAAEDIRESASGQDRDTSSLEEQSLTTNPQGIMCDNKEDKTNDAPGTEEKTQEDKNVATTTPYEDSEENSLIQVDCSQLEQKEHLEKDDENTSLTEAPTRDNTESTLVKEEAQVEKPIDSLQAATEDIKASEDTVTGSIEEQIPTADPQEISSIKTEDKTTDATADPQEISSIKTEDKTTDAAYTKEKTLEDIATSFSNWDNEDNSPIKVGGSQKPSLNEASMGNTNNDESTIIHEAKFANDLTKAHLFENEKNKECTSVKEEVSIESLQEADEDIKVSASGQDREISYLEEQGLTTNPQGIIGDHKEDKTSDATDLKEETPEDKNVATTIPHEDTEENSLIQVDCSQMEQKIHLEKASDNAFLTEAPTEDTTESTSKEEAQVEKSIDSSKVATEDIKASASSQDTETSFIKEQIPTADPQEISCEKTEEKTIDAYYTEEETLEDIVINVPNGDNEDNSAIELYGSQQPSLKEVSTGNNNDVESTITHEAKFEDENLIKADLFEKEKYTEGTSVNEKVSIESFRVGAEGIKASASGQDRETSYLEEQRLTTNPQEIIFDHKEDKTSDATDLKEETPEDKNVATTIPHEDTEENLLIQVDCSQMEQKIHLEKASDNAFLTKAPIEGTTESTLKEEALVEKPIHSSQVATEDIKAFASRQDTETSFIEEQIPTVDPQKISCDKTEEKTIDASDTEEETLEDIETNVPNGDNEDNSAIEAYGSQKPSLKEASTGNNNDVESTIMHEAKFEDENLIKTDLFENEKYTEGTLVNEKVSIESLQAGAEDIKASVSVQDREAISQEVQTLTTNPQEIIGKHKEEKTIEATDLKEETPEDRNIATIIPYEDAEENSLIQVDCSQMEQNEHLGKESDLREAPTGHTTESALLKDEAQVEKLIDSFQVATEDIKASSSGQDTETSSIEEKILTVDPQETSGDRTKEETIDATDTKEEFPEVQDIATTVPNADNEDNSPTEVDGSQKRSLKEASTGNVKDHELTIMHEAKFVDESSIKADLFENEKNTEGTSIKEEIFIESLQVAAEHITASASGQDRETSSLEEQSLTAHPQEIMGDNKEDKTIDPTDMREETSKDKVLKEIEDIDIRAKTIELNEEEVYLKDLQMTTEVNIAAHEEKGSNSIAVKLPSTNGPDVNKDMVVDIAEDPNCKQEESSITKSSEENMVISNENVANVTSLASEASELREAETQGPNEEKEAEFMQQDPEVGTDQKDIEEELPVNVSQDVSESNGVNVEEERRNSNNCKEISNISNSVAIEEVSSSNVASEEDSTSNPFQESRRETQQEAENEEAQKQDEDLHLSALIQDSSMEKTNENLVETDPKESTEAEAQGPNEEKEAELMQQDPEAGTDQKDIEVELPINASQDVSESNGVNGEEERRNSNNCKEISNNSNSVALEEVSSSNMASEEGSTSSPFQESRRETQQEAENEEAQKQDEDLHLSALIQDSSMEKTNENLVETDPKESTEAEAQGPNEEKEAELMQQDPEAGTDQKDIEVELPINASKDVSESKGVNGEEERRNSNNWKEISNSSNSVALEEVSSSNMASEEGSTSNPFQESRRETQQEAENEEAQKQDEDLHVSALIQDSSMEKIEKDVQLCLASANDSEITQEMQKLEEASLPAPDENIIENTERKESEVVEDATKNKYIEHMEQDDTTKSFLDDQKPTKREQEETECRQEKVLLDETVEQIKESTSIRVANDFLPKSFTETSEVDHPTAERELTINREDLQTGKTATGDDEETKIDKDEEEEAYEQQISDFSSAAPNIIEARDQDVARLLSEAPEETVILNDIREANIFYKTTDTTESAEINNNKSVEDIHVNNRSTADLETKIDDEAPETVPRATEGRAVQSTIAWETSMLISQGERDEYEHAYIGSMIEEKSDSNEIEFASEESKSGYESKNQVLESIAQVQSCDIIPKAGETETEEENLEAAAEIKSEEVAAEEIFEPEETTYEKETMKVNISSEKIKEEDEDVVGYHLGSRKEEVITESHLEDEVKQEEETNTEEIFEIIKNANETEKVSKVSEEADDKAVEEPEENLLANESIDRSLHQKERGKSVEEVTTILATEEAPGLDHAYINTGTQDSREEVNSSTVAFLEDEDNRTGADDVDNEMAKDEGLLNQNSNTSVIDAASGELPKRHDENIICEAPPAKTVHKTIEDTEGKQENANTITMQHQEEDNTSKHESHPLPEFTQGNESEKQDQKNEICSSDEVQAKDEENLMLSAGKSEEEAKKADTCSKPTEDEDRNIYVEAEKVDFSSHTEDTSEVSHNDGAQDIPEDNENSTIKNKYSEEKYPNKNTESQISTVSEDIELIEQASKATRITVEMQETKAGSGSGAVPEATGVDSGQVEEVSDKCKGMAETSTSVEPTTISTSKIMLEYTVGTSLEAKDQLTKLHDLPQESDVGYSEVKMAQKDGPFDLQNVRDQSEGVQELNEGSVEVSNKENPVEADPNENIEARVSSEGQEAEAIQKAPVSETLKEETEEQQPERTSEAVSKAKGVNCQDKKIIDDKNNDLKENSCRAESAKISESNVHQSSMEDDKNQESQRQIDSLPISPTVKCSDIEIAEKDLPMHFAGLDGTDVTELEVTPLPSKDKHVVLEADQTEKMNPENSIGNKNISVIQHGDSAECSQGEHEILKPSKLEPEEAKCGHEERTSQETTKSRENSESKEIDTPSLSDLFQASVKETSQMVYHSAIEKEPTTHREDLQAEKTDDTEHEDAKTDEEKDDEEESSEQRRSDLGSEAPVMVNMGDADVKVAHKKSHNILSGVGSKVKHSIAKVKKAITGKSSHPKPPSSQKTAVS